MLKSYLRHRMADKRIDDITDLMQLSGVSRNSINKLYRGTDLETLKLDTLMRLCDALECKFSDLVEYTPNNK
ncbi:MAG: helix-turn-helix transcriptional regulator [Oscillospiraceae bacterium]